MAIDRPNSVAITPSRFRTLTSGGGFIRSAGFVEIFSTVPAPIASARILSAMANESNAIPIAATPETSAAIFLPSIPAIIFTISCKAASASGSVGDAAA